MPDTKRATQEILQALAFSTSPIDRLLTPTLLLLGAAYAALRLLAGAWPEALFTLACAALLFTLAAFPRVQSRLLDGPYGRRHAFAVVLLWLYGSAGFAIARGLATAPTGGKDSPAFYGLVLAGAAICIMIARALLLLTPRGARWFVTRIPLWEQALVAANEAVAAVLVALFFGPLLAHAAEPSVFTLRVDFIYTLAVGAVLILYYAGMQVMWLQRGNDWLSQTRVWVRLARLLTPPGIVIVVVVLVRPFIERADPRSAELLGSGAGVAVLALAPVLLLLVIVIALLVYSSSSGLRERFLPGLLLERLPMRLRQFLSTISDMDLLLILAVLATLIPVALLLEGSGGLLADLRLQILRSSGLLIETSEQALALLFALPFYALIFAALGLYAYAISRKTLSARDRDALVAKLPLGFLILLIIALYLFAVPLTQVITEGRLPRLPQDSVRIILFNILIPLVLLYATYFVFVRIPYRRGQNRWRDIQQHTLNRDLTRLDERIDGLNRELAGLEERWRSAPPEGPARTDMLFHYVQLNGIRDDLNMRRLQSMSERQQLFELSETPGSLAVARLPLRIVTIGVPLLIALQVYQWAVLNNGLRQIVENPNATVLDFLQALVSQLNP
ncbi:MAG TPA: hypothetical protein VER79_03470 [Candidatus Limnocylindrales bacterium]|nr:hypothetical protein [Candidatus Limnocylindrales bacterium]